MSSELETALDELLIAAAHHEEVYSAYLLNKPYVIKEDKKAHKRPVRESRESVEHAMYAVLRAYKAQKGASA